MTFAELQFEVRQDGGFFMGHQARVYFPNGYGASVIQGPYTFGGSRGLYELAVLVGTADQSLLAYETPVTDDVLGHLTPDEVTRLLQAIEALPPDPEAYAKAQTHQEALYARVKANLPMKSEDEA